MGIKQNLVIDQGTTFSANLVIKDSAGDLLDLTNYTANSQMRKHYTSNSSTTFTTAVNTTSSVVTISLTANETSNVVFGRYLYDLEITSNTGIITRSYEGLVTVTPEITK
jgi:hypothetical protein|tara:strand:+ start:12353 stop:12682 length:330 start_codon:yes stop_codon:yes gene_type:complete